METIADKSRTKEIIERLQAILEAASPVPLASGKVMIYKEEVQALLNELKDQMDIELKTYHEVNDKKGKIINEAKKEAEKIIYQAEHTASRVRVNKRTTNVDPVDFSRLTQAELDELDNANEIYGASLIYTDEMLTEVSNLITETYENMRNDYEVIMQAMEEKIKTLADNKAELMAGLSEMDGKERSQQILEIGQLLSNELFNARMNSHKNPDLYEDGSMQLTFDLKTEQETRILETEKALQEAEENAKEKEKALIEAEEAAKEKEKALIEAEETAKEKEKALIEAEEAAKAKEKKLKELAAERDELMAKMAELERRTKSELGEDAEDYKQEVEETGIKKTDAEESDIKETDEKENETKEFNTKEADIEDDDEEYEIVYVDEDELEEGEEYEIVYVDEDELEEGEEYEIEYVDEEDSESYEGEADENIVKKDDIKEGHSEEKSAKEDIAKEDAAKKDIAKEDTAKEGASKVELEKVKKVEELDDNIVPMIPHFNKSQKIATVPSEQVAKMANAMKNDKKYSGVISRAVSEREKAEAEAAVSVEKDDDMSNLEKTGNGADKTTAKKAGDSPHKADMKIEEKYDITEF